MFDACVNAFLGESSVSFLLMISTNIPFYHTNLVSGPKKGHLQLFFLANAQNQRAVPLGLHIPEHVAKIYPLPLYRLCKLPVVLVIYFFATFVWQDY